VCLKKGKQKWWLLSFALTSAACFFESSDFLWFFVMEIGSIAMVLLGVVLQIVVVVVVLAAALLLFVASME